MTTKRSNGEGTDITRGDDGRYHAWLSMGLKTGGRRDRRHVSGQTRAEVSRKLRALQAQRDAGVVPDAGRAPTVAAWLEHWLDNIATHRVRTKTLQGYRGMVRHRIAPALGHHRLDRLQPEHVEAFYAGLKNEGLSASTVLQCHRILSRAVKVAMQRGKVSRNVCGLVDAPSVTRPEIQPLTATEARALLNAATDTRNAARWSVALSLGLRQGEALGLAWDAVDLDTGVLTVRRALQRLGGQGLVMVEPKSRAGRRRIALPAQLVEGLRSHRAAQLEGRLKAGSEWKDHGLVFAQPNGKPIDPRADNRAWKALLQAAGVRDARLHDARHTAATLLLLQGVDNRVVMELLGHSQLSMTARYQHVLPELARDAAERMGKALWG
ncbi:MAG: site-specific integrase [Actinomycetota bacterium]|nr:site-specific integrase [Actinomycetota bacterium]